MRKDKFIVEVIFTILIFSVIFVFSTDISSYFEDIEESNDIKPIKSLFWFLKLLFELFGDWLFLIIFVFVVIGVIYLIENRRR